MKEQNFSRAIMGTDLSKASEAMIKWSPALKSVGVQKITLVYALGLSHVQAFEDMLMEGKEEKIAAEKKLLEQQGFEVDTKIAQKLPADELENAAKNTRAGLIIIGSGGASFSASILGSTAHDILNVMKTPVLLVRLMKKQETSEQNYHIPHDDLLKNTLMPVDFSDASDWALLCMKKSNLAPKDVQYLHIQSEERTNSDEMTLVDQERLNRIQHSMKSGFHEAESGTLLKLHKYPGTAITDYANQQKTSLTIMGSQGKGFLKEVFLGSVSRKVAETTPSHLLLIPHPSH